MQPVADDDTDANHRQVMQQPRQRRQQAAVEQIDQCEQAVQAEPDSDQGGAQAGFIETGAGQGIHQQRAAGSEQAVGGAGSQHQAAGLGRRSNGSSGRRRGPEAPQFAAGEAHNQYPKQGLQRGAAERRLQQITEQRPQGHQRQNRLQ